VGNLPVEETTLDLVSQLKVLYGLIDKAVAELQLKSGLRCPIGCGDCCRSADVQVSVLEMLPMAREMLRDGTAQQLNVDYTHRQRLRNNTAA
jgi:predicted aldo/keto reductase-like oxidoreductase